MKKAQNQLDEQAKAYSTISNQGVATAVEQALEAAEKGRLSEDAEKLHWAADERRSTQITHLFFNQRLSAFIRGEPFFSILYQPAPP